MEHRYKRDPFDTLPKTENPSVLCEALRHQGTQATKLVPQLLGSPANQRLYRALGPGTRADSRAELNNRLFLPTSRLFFFSSSHSFSSSQIFFLQSRVNVVLVATWLPVRRQVKRYSCFPTINENIILFLTCRASHGLR